MFCQLLDVIERRRGQYSVPEIEDVARTSACAAQHFVSSGEDTLDRAKQHRGIEVALNAVVVTDLRPRFIERLAPVNANHFASRRRELADDRGGGDAAVEYRLAHA